MPAPMPMMELLRYNFFFHDSVSVFQCSLNVPSTEDLVEIWLAEIMASLTRTSWRS